MTFKVINQTPYLRTSRQFPDDIDRLSVEVDRAYIEIAQAINVRTIGIFPKNAAAVTGNSYYFTSTRRQSLRELYSFTSTVAIDHHIDVTDISNFIFCTGTYTDGTNSYGLIWGTTGPIPNQISFYLTLTQIIFVVGAGAPALVSGSITLEWLSNA